MAKQKLWYQSKTVWVNALILAAGIFEALAGELQSGATLTSIGVVNIALRVATKNSIKW